jgi:hypothetical protein
VQITFLARGVVGVVVLVVVLHMIVVAMVEEVLVLSFF